MMDINVWWAIAYLHGLATHKNVVFRMRSVLLPASSLIPNMYSGDEANLQEFVGSKFSIFTWE